MQINELPRYDSSDNSTGCCPRFKEEGWDRVELHLRDLPMLRATTRSFAHVPLNMGKVMTRVLEGGKASDAFDPEHWLVLSRDLSPFAAEHLFFVRHPVEGEEMTTLSGDYLTHCFEGPYSQVGHWCRELQDLARDRGHSPGKLYFFYTTCPKCAKAYGRNPVVGLVELN
jgi:hypothetical protein